jgi:hypothetical protein
MRVWSALWVFGAVTTLSVPLAARQDHRTSMDHRGVHPISLRGHAQGRTRRHRHDRCPEAIWLARFAASAIGIGPRAIR